MRICVLGCLGNIMMTIVEKDPKGTHEDDREEVGVECSCKFLEA